MSMPYRVMVVDDSAVIRGFVTRWLEEDPAIQVVSSAADGALALRALQKASVEVIVLDIEMPELDGMSALPLLLEADPNLQVIMASTLTLRNATVSLKALAMGAADYIAKPTTTRDPELAASYRRELAEKVNALGAARRSRLREALPGVEGSKRLVPAKPDQASAAQSFSLRPLSPVPTKAIAIGSSTGGPRALLDLFGRFGKGIALPIFITQHMPPTFTTILAEHIGQTGRITCVEAGDGDPVADGQVYLAPGGYHMTVRAGAQGSVIRLTQDPPENFCRPSVDTMYRSLVQTYRGGVLAVMLTGMGADGLQGARAIVEAGGNIVAQDEATSVVWGMPGAVATDGLCAAVLPLPQIGVWIARCLARDVS